ncbi:MAG TPA: tetratricopeptide repeat protein, partial [Candidatus Nanoarchaeia archaeon]|nr:tetratricopeptide repeat protein [Candidatus Nanoarchaeia archaeon]
AIEEYEKALEFYPYKGNEPELFSTAAEFLFKCNYNMAACYSYLDDFNRAIGFFDMAVMVNSVPDETKVRALMGKGSCYYRKKMLVEGRYKAGAYRISMDTEWELTDEKIQEFRNEDRKKNFIKLAHECFAQAADLDRSNVEAWYNKGHMEFLMGKIKDALQSFDNVINLNKNFENKESIPLFDEIKKEKGVPIKGSEIIERTENASSTFKTKTGHLVRTRAESEIADFLFEHNMVFQYNNVATWASKDDFRPSFYVPKLDLYIDHFPFDYVKEFQKVMKSTIKEYEKHRKKHIYLTSEDDKSIEENLKLKLKPYVIL